ncbi:hypothetical protein [Anaeromyxobacter oryzae]|uniref:Uncharacterized protein n=1 Tax=Anaeromyxobacter oryzae TaxID=2918170 RepID=A0ABM7WQZ2_9BACT|nr:hypothetical protein [Anaeromyxobacter oryzae]BDG01892.1 hypothetical protein AMOR_08880 [Anaeromyxobacter oryzae]
MTLSWIVAVIGTVELLALVLVLFAMSVRGNRPPSLNQPGTRLARIEPRSGARLRPASGAVSPRITVPVQRRWS